jgi:GNAT superfamily N-acetyltransferase
MKIRKVKQEEIGLARQLFEEYAMELNVDLCFQNFEKELSELPGIYSEPEGSILLLENDNAVAVGIVALKKLEDGVCEMKRLYLKPEARKNGNGRKLAEAILYEAKAKSYTTMKLDTIQRLVAAVKLYRSMGFEETEAYNYNPDATVLYFKKKL